MKTMKIVPNNHVDHADQVGDADQIGDVGHADHADHADYMLLYKKLLDALPAQLANQIDRQYSLNCFNSLDNLLDLLDDCILAWQHSLSDCAISAVQRLRALRRVARQTKLLFSIELSSNKTNHMNLTNHINQTNQTNQTNQSCQLKSCCNENG